MSRRTIEGKYEIIKKIGSGAMGQVFLGKDTRLGRPVAVKFLNPGIAENAKARKRFLDEGKNLAKLGQANLATIYDCGEENDQPFMVMEFIDGTPLEEVLKRDAMPTDVAVPILLEVLAGIEHAHGKGVVHRDIKPSNILLTHDGHAKVIDFGIAFDPDSERKTIAGDILCTPAYASPEQAAGKTEEIDHQSDVYSMGAVLFEMLTGKPPLDKGSNHATLIAHATEDAPSLPDHFDPALVATVNKSLARDKAKRFQTTGEFKAALISAVPTANLKPDSVTLYLEKSPRATVFEIDPDVPVETVPKKKVAAKLRTRSKGPRISWMIYAAGGVFLAALTIGLWVLKVVRERSEPIPPPTFVFQMPLPPKGWDVVSPVNLEPQQPQGLPKVPKAPPRPPALSADERVDLEKNRAVLEIELKKNTAALKSLKALGEDEKATAMEKRVVEQKQQLDSVLKRLSAR